MEKKIESILQDLYLIDESLRSQEKELVVILEEFLKVRPDTKLDRDFVVKLREELLAKASRVPGKKGVFLEGVFMNMRALMSKRSYYAFASIALVIGVATTAYYFGAMSDGARSPVQPAQHTGTLGSEIIKLADNAFGTIGLSSESRGGMATATRPQSGGGGAGLGSVIGVTPAYPMMEGSSGDATMIAPEIWNFAYTYVGDVIELADAKGSVYKKKAERIDGGNLSQILNGFNFGSFDVSRLSNVKVNNMSLIEDRDFGYAVSLDFWSGNISIGTNWERWQKAEYECRDEACFNAYRLKSGDMLSDADILVITDRFLNDYGVDMAGYGAGEIQKDFAQPMPLAVSGQTEMYVSDRVSVLYPQIIDGKQVFEMYGGKSGMTVDFDARNKRVAGAYYSFFKKYESSDYDLETDFSKITSIAIRGGSSGNYENFNPTKIIEIKLGTPSRELTKVFNYNQRGEGEELIVPAMVFPVLNQKETGIYQRHIIVPLVTGLDGMPGGTVGGGVPVMIQKPL